MISTNTIDSQNAPTPQPCAPPPKGKRVVARKRSAGEPLIYQAVRCFSNNSRRPLAELSGPLLDHRNSLVVISATPQHKEYTPA